MTEDTRKLIATLLADPEPDVRRHAAETLAAAPGLAAVAALAASLQDENKGVRDAASRSLCMLGGPNVANAIVEYIGDRNIVTRNLASELLVRLGTTSIPAVMSYLNDPDRDARKFAVDILGLIGSPVAADRLVQMLDDPDENVVVSTVEALGNMGATETIQQLCAAYDRYEYTRPAVVEALGKIGDPTSGDFLLLRFQEALAHAVPDPVLLFALIEALGIVGTPRTAAVLQHNMAAVNGRLRSALLHTLVQIAGRSGGTLAFPDGMRTSFIQAFHDPEPAIRLSAAKVLVTMEGSDVTSELICALGSSSDLDTLLMGHLPARANAFAAAVQYLEDHRQDPAKGVIALMGRLAADLSRTLMHGAFNEHIERQMERGFILIADRWASADEETRAMIVDVLFRFDGDNAIEFVDALMNDPDPWLRIHVIEIISAIADPRVLNFIARFLNDEDDMVREVAMGSLQSRGYAVDTAGLEA